METRYESAWSSHVTGMTDLPRPAVPTGLAVDADATDHDSIGWEWDAVTGVDSYEAQFSTSQPFVDTDQIFNTDTTSHVVHKLDPETNGYLRVRSVVGTGSDSRRSEWSATSTGITGAAPEPDPLDAPENFESSDPENNSIVLTWDAVDDADHYEVEQREGGASSWDDASCGSADGDNEVDDTECIASGLDEGTDYDFRVRAVPADNDSAHLNSGWSDIVESRTSGTAQTPTTPTSGGMGSLDLRWQSDAGSITWIWDRVAGETYDYVIVDSDFDDSANPCEDQWDNRRTWSRRVSPHPLGSQ